MTRIISRGALIGLAVAPLVALAACGSSGGGGVSSAATSATTSASSSASSGNGQSAATVDAANNSLGSILVDQQGRTLYLFAKDSSTTSTCTDACAVAWPPLRSNAQPTVAGSGTDPSLIGTTPRSDGSPQVTYNGHPLYLFKGDQKAGDANGQGVNAFGAAWYALSPTGDQITAGASSAGGNGSGY
jgi:predicted lipoprotein with Yx(FWY)xxD motif